MRSKDFGEVNLEHHHQKGQQLHGCVLSSRLMEQCRMWRRDALEDLAVRVKFDVSRQCYRPSHNLWRSLWGNAVVRAVCIKPVFIAFCGMRSGNRTYQDCSMPWVRTIQIVDLNSVRGFCTCVMYFPVIIVWSDEATVELNGTVCICTTKIHKWQKNKQLIF
jgi:hypothetical protein